MTTRLFTVPSLGIGRRDYSKSIEFATQATTRGHQARVNTIGDYVGVPVTPFPGFGASFITFFDENDALVTEAPGIPYHIYEVIVTSGRNALVICGLYRFNSVDEAYAWNVEKWYGDIYGYGQASLTFTNGIKTQKGKVYVVGLMEYSEEALCELHLLIHMLTEEVIYG